MPQDLLLPESILPLLKTRRLGRVIHHFQQTSSTNDVARRLAEQGVAEGALVLAEEQTRGRGRVGRAWHSERGKGIYASILLRPTMKPREAPVLTLAAALAVAEAIEQVCDLNADIKWPNDLLLGGRKCCGILSEMHAEIDKIRSVVVGIGINVNHSGFPEALGQPATSLRIECKRVCSRVAVLCALLERFELLYEDLQQGRRAAVLRRWMARSSFAVGKCLALDLGNDRQIEGKTAGLSETGNLKIELADGRVEEFLSGEIVAWR